MSGHTPGPWCYRINKGFEHEPVIIAENAPDYAHQYVAQCNGIPNARLIAAAPDLLAALEGLLPAARFACEDESALDGTEGTDQARLEAAYIAIAKATGQAVQP